ncbi:arabinose transporter (plasmid) [Rhizobium brockwellii]|nr:MFS transporter [Rhizobium brockwellii]TAX26737.1 MFS transporter [Rhizobium leguminosarum]QJX08434.1 arabinose transporter [Rhizobium brockwellii]TAX28180.1 MFS transporter [Rhizobium leguminosarum]TAX88393.1 MFS transporter [Rhizobium leguminosarum]
MTGRTNVLVTLAPKMAVVFVGFLIAGMGITVLPIHVSSDLGFGTFVIGLITGSQFCASLMTRLWAGDFADRKGPKKAVILGLSLAAAAGALYLASLITISQPVLSAAILVAGRGVLGAGESLIITGSVAWGLATVGSQHSGKVIAWIGTAMFGALAAGAPIGSALFAMQGFAAIASATILLPLLMAAMIAPLEPVSGRSSPSASRLSVIRAVWLPGLGSAFASLGYGSILAFSSLLFVDRQWADGWLAVTSFATALVASRILLGHLPDRLGGPFTALVFAIVEAIGLVTMGLASQPIVALAGAALVGFGYSLVFPGFGIAVVRAAPSQSRGMAMGLYSACLDVALAFSGPALGLVGDVAGLPAIFVTTGGFVSLSTFVALFIIRRGQAGS